MAHLYFDMCSGISGDMILGALMDLGLDFNQWHHQMKTLGLNQVEVRLETVNKKGISAKQVSILTPDEHHHRHLKDIEFLISNSKLPDTVKKRALPIFKRLALAEARIHGIGINQVHFHEVGALDSIYDIVGVCMGIELLGIDKIYTGPFVFGSGTATMAHGTYPLPVPAVVKLVEGFPSKKLNIPFELTTPTGAAIVVELAQVWNREDEFVTIGSGYGAGKRDLRDRPNVLRLLKIEDLKGGQKQIYQMQCNLDDMTPEVLSFTCEQLFETGALDVWQEPITMKKNRLAIKLCALVPAEILDNAAAVFAGQTTTGGFRYFKVQREIGEKQKCMLKTPWGMVEGKKISFSGRKIQKVFPEYESCRKLAKSKNLNLMEVYFASLSEFRKSGETDTGSVI